MEYPLLVHPLTGSLTAIPAAFVPPLNLRNLRRGHNLTQADLSRKSGVGTVTISRAENGGLLSIETLKRLQVALGVPFVAFLWESLNQKFPDETNPRMPQPQRAMPRLKTLRDKKKYSQADLAAEAGVSLKTIQRAEKGARIRACLIRRLEEILK